MVCSYLLQSRLRTVAAHTTESPPRSAKAGLQQIHELCVSLNCFYTRNPQPTFDPCCLPTLTLRNWCGGPQDVYRLLADPVRMFEPAQTTRFQLKARPFSIWMLCCPVMAAASGTGRTYLFSWWSKKQTNKIYRYTKSMLVFEPLISSPLVTKSERDKYFVTVFPFTRTILLPICINCSLLSLELIIAASPSWFP